MPRVTVVIPTYDRLRMLLEHSLPSALGQEGVEVEVVIVCDGSPEPVVRHLETLGEDRVRVLRHVHSRGVSAARNTGIQAASTEWVAILDDDDLWAPTKLAAQVEAATRVGAGFAYSAAVIVDDHLRVRALTSAPAEDGLLRALLSGNVMPGGGSNLVVRRQVLNSIGGFDPELRYMSDWDLALRLAAAASGAAVYDPLVAWVRHVGATAPSRSLVRGDLRRLRTRHAELFIRNRIEPDEAALLVWVGNSELETAGRGHRLRALRAFLAGARAGRQPLLLLHAGRSLLGGRANAALRSRLRGRPSQPAWLVARQGLVHARGGLRRTGRPALPSMDVVVPTMDRPFELRRLLRSIAAESYPGLRAVIVDMNEDDAAAVVLAERSDELEVVHVRASRRGTSAARNLGIEHAAAEVVAFADDDCWYPPGLLRTIGDRFARAPGLGGVTVMQVDHQGRPSNGRWARRPGRVTRTNVWGRGVTAGMFFRRSVLEATGPLDETMGPGSGGWQAGEETDLLIRVVDGGHSVEYDPHLFVHHPDPLRDNAGSYPLERWRGYAKAMGHLMRKHRYPGPIVAYRCVRPLAGSVVALVRGDLVRARIGVTMARGRTSGWVRSPARHAQGVDTPRR